MTDREVVLADVNLLLALVSPAHVHNETAKSWFAHNPEVGVATTALTEVALVRLLMNAHVVGAKLDPQQALQILRGLRERPGHRFVADDSSLVEPRIDLRVLAGSKQVADLHLVNLAAVNSIRMATLDRRLHGALTEADRAHVELIAA